ncbi:WD40 repeat domain-containing protein [Geodermatophilus sp. SYSU D01105]
MDLPFGCRACQPQLSPSPDGRLVAYVDGASSGQSLATVYRLEGQGDPQLLSDPSAPADGSFRLDAVVPVWSHDGRRLVLLGPGDDTALSFDAEDLRQPPVRWPPAYSSADPLVARLSADGGRLLVVYADGTVVVRDVHDGTAVETIPGGAELDRLSWPPPPTAAAVSPDLTTVALVEQDDVHLLDIRTGERRPLPGGPADGVLFTGNQLLVLRPDRTVDVWDPHGRSVLRTTAGGDYALPLAAPHDSHVLARLRSDDSVVLTLTGSGTTLGELPLPPTQGSATNLAFTEDGRYLVVGTTGGRLTRWDMTEAAWLHHACQTAGRDLTTGEWRRFVGTDPPADLRCDRAL